jgi:hypothetical protein
MIELAAVPVYAQGDPGNGIGGYDLRSPADHAFAFDYGLAGHFGARLERFARGCSGVAQWAKEFWQSWAVMVCKPWAKASAPSGCRAPQFGRLFATAFATATVRSLRLGIRIRFLYGSVHPFALRQPAGRPVPRSQARLAPKGLFHRSSRAKALPLAMTELVHPTDRERRLAFFGKTQSC